MFFWRSSVFRPDLFLWTVGAFCIVTVEQKLASKKAPGIEIFTCKYCMCHINFTHALREI